MHHTSIIFAQSKSKHFIGTKQNLLNNLTQNFIMSTAVKAFTVNVTIKGLGLLQVCVKTNNSRGHTTHSVWTCEIYVKYNVKQD